MRRRAVGGLAGLALVGLVVGVPTLLFRAAGAFGLNRWPSWDDIAARLTRQDDGTAVAAFLLVAGGLAWAYLMVCLVAELASRRRHWAPSAALMQPGRLFVRLLLGAAAGLFLSFTAVATATAEDLPPAASALATPTAAAPSPPILAADQKAAEGASRAADGGESSHVSLDGNSATGPTADGGENPGPAMPTSSPTAAASASSPPLPAAGSADEMAATAAVDDGLDFPPAPIRTTDGVGSILAAGVFAVLSRSRARQLWRRPPGATLPAATAADAREEDRLRLVADPDLVWHADRALRALLAGCAAAGADLPCLRVARVTDSELQLFLAEPVELAAPWSRTADPAVWVCPFDRVAAPAPASLAAAGFSTVGRPAADDPLRGVQAPYPALVCVGQDAEGAHVLIDLEQAGSLGFVGPPEAVEEAMAALAVELSTSAWADDISVTTVDGLQGIEDAYHTGCLRHSPRLGPLLAPLASRAAQDRRAFAAAGLSPDGPLAAPPGLAALRRARLLGLADDAWCPEIIVLAGATTPAERSRLRGLLTDQPRVALAAVTKSDDLMGDYRVEFADGGALLQPFGLPIVPQRLPRAVLQALGRVIALADTAAETASPAASPASPETASPAASPTSPETASPAASPTSPEAGPSGQTFAANDGVWAGLVAELEREAALDRASAPLRLSPRETPLSSPFAVFGDADSAGPTPAAVGAEAGPAAVLPLAEPQADGPGQLAGPAGSADVVRPESTSAGASRFPPPPASAALAVPSQPGLSRAQPLVEPVGRKPYVRILGPVAVTGTTSLVEPSKANRLTEYLAYLVLNPDSKAAAIDDAIWPNRPREANASTRNTATSKLRRWLGENEAGELYLPLFSYTCVGVGCDWADWTALVGGGPLSLVPAERLAAALRLIRGRPFDGVHQRSYRWADSLRRAISLAVTDVAWELARRCFEAGDYQAVDQALATALVVSPGDEAIWRLRIAACHAAGDHAGEAAAIDRVCLVAAELGCDLSQATVDLIDRLHREHGATRR
ncbi:MAG: bacterial transcriptional activator domain-containing protein [Propionibacteriaceae bacterium]|jgi:DNA-binding SARP family transcriptional activator|nr:bacterial transcriptional activator domain-containing protein [Propionibacteriaceae bacterium]